MYLRLLILAAVFSASIVAVSAQGTTEAPTLSEEQECNRYNYTDCKTCINEGNSSRALKCYWCGATGACRLFDFGTAIPVSGVDCPNIRYNVGTCSLDALAIVIMIVVACFVFTVLLCCLCCCICIACAKRKRRSKILEESRFNEEKDNIRQKSAERRAERKAKHDEIRRKYGLNTEDDGDGSYKRLS